MRANEIWLTCALALAACAGETATGGASGSALEAPPTVEGEGTTRSDVESATRPIAPTVVDGEGFVAIRAATEPGLAEDGDGHLVQSASPVAIELDGHVFPPRALDPVLTIGQRRFTHYAHPEVGVLRFTIADASLLVPGERVAVHYARDASDERVVHVLTTADLDAARQP